MAGLRSALTLLLVPLLLRATPARGGAGSVYLKVMLTCNKKSNGDIYGFWEFGLNGQRFLLLYPENGKWEMVHPAAKPLKEKWEKDSEMIRFLKMMSMGDCKMWLKAFAEYRDINGYSSKGSSSSVSTRRSYTIEILTSAIIFINVFF